MANGEWRMANGEYRIAKSFSGHHQTLQLFTIIYNFLPVLTWIIMPKTIMVSCTRQ